MALTRETGRNVRRGYHLVQSISNHRKRERREAATPRTFAEWVRKPTAELPPDLTFEEWLEWGQQLSSEQERVKAKDDAVTWKIVQFLSYGHRYHRGRYEQALKIFRQANGKPYSKAYLKNLAVIGEATSSLRCDLSEVYTLPPSIIAPVATLPEAHQVQVTQEAIEAGQTSQRRFKNYVVAYKERVGLSTDKNDKPDKKKADSPIAERLDSLGAATQEFAQAVNSRPTSLVTPAYDFVPFMVPEPALNDLHELAVRRGVTTVDLFVALVEQAKRAEVDSNG